MRVLKAVDCLALMDIDRAPDVPFEAGVEKARRVLQRCTLGERQLHDGLVRLAGADDSVVRPHGDPSPLPLLDHFGVGFLDEGTDPGQRLAAPVVELIDPRIDESSGRVVVLRAGLLHVHPLVACPVRHRSFYPITTAIGSQQGADLLEANGLVSLPAAVPAVGAHR